jgi:zinc carboxypeptidase/carboxypeptidase M14-like protein
VNWVKTFVSVAVLMLQSLTAITAEPAKVDAVPPACPLVFINSTFENASPLFWEISESGEVEISLMYDHERGSLNRAAGHWHFRVEAPQGSRLTLILGNLENIYNGRKGSPASDGTMSFVSVDGRSWEPAEMELLEGNRLKLELTMRADSMYVARLEPYRLSDLNQLLEEIRSNQLVTITEIGRTVEDRPLEIVQVGNADAPNRILLRARAHPWEPGGNWVIEGLVRRLLKGDPRSKAYLQRYCVYIMPMANKDGVARGWTRFNVLGKDLNRNWDVKSAPELCPENHALETWIEEQIAEGRGPDFMIDWHNDQGGNVHISRPNVDLDAYLARMERFETLLRQHTWFTEGATGGNYRNPGTIGEGLLERYGIHACVHELNANRIAGLDDYPNSKNWQLYGEQLCEVFYRLFDEVPGN